MITIYQAGSDSSQNDINSAGTNNNNSFLALSVDSFLEQLWGGGGCVVEEGDSKGLSAYAEHCLEHMSRLPGNQFVMRRTI